ncbi:MAG: restriction endonuclease subunit S [Defluviitaleaceae bacterium]|nr:restriction endonuclease subunit S [Defluviitaleaceae bacterium]
MYNDCKVPEIRFEEYEGDWVVDKLGELTDVYDGTHQTPVYTESGITFLSVENIKTLTSNKYISIEAFNNDFKVYPQKGDVLMTRIGDIGTANIVESDDVMAYYVSLALLKKKSLNPYFLKSVIHSEAVRREIWHRTLHIAFPKKINMNEIKKVHVVYPVREEEQSAIGDFFRNLDDTIALKKQQNEKTLNIKKAMLEKMFPKKGESVPEIRFEGFTGRWQRISIGDFAYVNMGQSPDSVNYTDNPNDHILVQGNADMKNGWVIPRVWTKQITKTARKGDIIISVRAPVGDVGKTAYNAVIGRGVAAIRGNEFLFQTLIKMNMDSFWDEYSTGSTFDSITSVNLRDAEIVIPNEEEQTAIGNFFHNLDTLITAQQQELEKLQNIKTACLNKMFV